MATIYDIENIRHGVVYAQTPLNMNDPFDSMIGYSPEKMYENCISLLMDAVKIDDENTRIIVEFLLKHKVSITLKFCTFFTLKKCTGTIVVSLLTNHLFPLIYNFLQNFCLL